MVPRRERGKGGGQEGRGEGEGGGGLSMVPHGIPLRGWQVGSLVDVKIRIGTFEART